MVEFELDIVAEHCGGTLWRKELCRIEEEWGVGYELVYKWLCCVGVVGTSGDRGGFLSGRRKMRCKSIVSNINLNFCLLIVKLELIQT